MEATEDVFAVSDRFVDEWCSLKPAAATDAGVSGYDSEWGDFSPLGIEREHSLVTSTLAKVRALTPSGDRWDLLARRVLTEFLDDHLLSIEHGDPFRDLNNVASGLQTLRETFDLMPRETPREWLNIAARLEGLGAAVDGYCQRLEQGRRDGIVVARRQVEAAVLQASSSAGGDSSFARFAHDAPQEVVDEVARGAERAHEAFGRLAQYLQESYLPSATETDAVGEERYRRHAASFLGMNVDVRALYEWGWTEVARLRAEMVGIGNKIDPGATIEGVLKLLKESPQHAAPDANEFVRLMSDRQQQALEDLDGVHFDVPEAIRTIDVQLAPPGGALGAYYTSPSEDFRRKGTVWYAFEDLQAPVPMFDHISTAYHEGFPGHHLQVGLQVSLAEALSRFHRLLVWAPGYAEGWALYAELLMDELGYLERPEYRMGMLAAQMLRACRVVIDIGMHLPLPIPQDAPLHPGAAWTPSIATEMLTTWAFLDRAYAESEVTRYLGWPGQAISYKVGEQTILDIRAAERARPGFEMKAFHARVLGSGPVGLDHLRELVLETDLG